MHGGVPAVADAAKGSGLSCPPPPGGLHAACCAEQTAQLGRQLAGDDVRLAVQGVGSAEDIDKGMRLGTNQPMGPLRLGDFIGERGGASACQLMTQQLRPSASLQLQLLTSLLLSCCSEGGGAHRRCPRRPRRRARRRQPRAHLLPLPCCLLAAGLDTCLSIMRVLHNGLGDPK